jgi:hypothetical protein
MADRSRLTLPKPSTRTADSEFSSLAEVLGLKRRKKTAREALEDAKKRK